MSRISIFKANLPVFFLFGKIFFLFFGRDFYDYFFNIITFLAEALIFPNFLKKLEFTLRKNPHRVIKSPIVNFCQIMVDRAVRGHHLLEGSEYFSYCSEFGQFSELRHHPAVQCLW